MSPTIVAFQGVHGAYSEEAVRQHFGDSVETLPCPLLGDVFQAVEAGSATYGMVPVENSVAGTVATAYELLSVFKDGGAAHEDWTALAIAFVASAITAFVAVKWLLRYIQTHRFTAFSVYRFVLGAALLMLVPAGE